LVRHRQSCLGLGLRGCGSGVRQPVAAGEVGDEPERPTPTARGRCGGSRTSFSAPARLTSPLS
jgi:hypothetical protein